MSNPPQGHPFGGRRPPAPHGYPPQSPPPGHFSRNVPQAPGYQHLSAFPRQRHHHERHYHPRPPYRQPPRESQPPPSGQDHFPVHHLNAPHEPPSVPRPPSAVPPSHCPPSGASCPPFSSRAPFPHTRGHNPSQSSSGSFAASSPDAPPRQPRSGPQPHTSFAQPPPAASSRGRRGDRGIPQASSILSTVSAFLESERRRGGHAAQTAAKPVGGGPPGSPGPASGAAGAPARRDNVPSRAETDVVVIDSSDDEAGKPQEPPSGGRSHGGRGRGEQTARGTGPGERRREEEKAAAVRRSQWLLQSDELRWESVPEFRSLARKRLHRGVLGKAQKIAEMEDGIRQTEEDEMTFIVHSESSNCRFVDLAVCECSCPNHEPPCSHLTAVALGGSSQDRLQFALMTLMKLRFLNPFADRTTSFIALSTREVSLSFGAIQKFVRSHFARRHTPEEVAEAAVRAAVGLLLRFYQRAQGTLPPLPSTVQRAKETEKEKGTARDSDDEPEETPEKEEANATEDTVQICASDSSADDSSESDEAETSGEPSVSREDDSEPRTSGTKTGKTEKRSREQENDVPRADIASHLARAVAKAAEELLSASTLSASPSPSSPASSAPLSPRSQSRQEETLQATCGEGGVASEPAGVAGPGARLELWCRFEQSVQARLRKSLKRRAKLLSSTAADSVPLSLAESATPPLLCLGEFLRRLARAEREVGSEEGATPGEAPPTEKENGAKDRKRDLGATDTVPGPASTSTSFPLSSSSTFSPSCASALSMPRRKTLTSAEAIRLLSLFFSSAQATAAPGSHRGDTETGLGGVKSEENRLSSGAFVAGEPGAEASPGRQAAGDRSSPEGGVESGKKREDLFSSAASSSWADRGCGEATEASDAPASPLAPASPPFGGSGAAGNEELLFSILSEVQKMRDERRRGISWNGEEDWDNWETARETEEQRAAIGGPVPRWQRRRRRKRQTGGDLQEIVECLAALEARVVSKRGPPGQVDGDAERADTRGEDLLSSRKPERGREAQASFLKCLLSLPEALWALGTALRVRGSQAGDAETPLGRRERQRDRALDSGTDLESKGEGRRHRVREERGRSRNASDVENDGVEGEDGGLRSVHASWQEAEGRHTAQARDEAAILTFFLAESFPSLFMGAPDHTDPRRETQALPLASPGPGSLWQTTDVPLSKQDRLRVYHRLLLLHVSGSSLSPFSSLSSGTSGRLPLPSLRQGRRLAALGRRLLGLSSAPLGEDSASDDSSEDASGDESGDRGNPTLSVEGQARLRDLYGASILPAVSLLSPSSLLSSFPSAASRAVASPGYERLSCPASSVPVAAASPPSSFAAGFSPGQVAWLIATAPPLVDMNFFLNWESTFAPLHGPLLSFLRRHLHLPLVPASASPAAHSSPGTLAASSFFLLLDPQTLVRLPRHTLASSRSSSSRAEEEAAAPQAEGPAAVAAFLQSLGRRCGQETAVSFLSLLCTERAAGRSAGAAALRGVGDESGLRTEIQRRFWGEIAYAQGAKQTDAKPHSDRDVQSVVAFASHFLLSLPFFAWREGIETLVSPLAARVGRRRLLLEMERLAYASWFSGCSASAAPSTSLPSSLSASPPVSLHLSVPSASCLPRPGSRSSSSSSAGPVCVFSGQMETSAQHLSQAQCAALEAAVSLCRDVLEAEEQAETWEKRGRCGELELGEAAGKSLLERHVSNQLGANREPGAEGEGGEAGSFPETQVPNTLGASTGENSHSSSVHADASEEPASGLSSPVRGARLESPLAPQEGPLYPSFSPVSGVDDEAPVHRRRRSSSDEEELLLSQPLLHLRKPHQAPKPGEMGERGREAGGEIRGVPDEPVSLCEKFVPFQKASSCKSEMDAGADGEARQRVLEQGTQGLEAKEEPGIEGKESLPCSESPYARQRAIIEAIRIEEFGVGLKLRGGAESSSTGAKDQDAPSQEALRTPEEREEKKKERETNALIEDVLLRQRQRLTRALDRLSRGLYTADSHLQMELLQNADDNNYSALEALRSQVRMRENASLSADGLSLALAEPSLHFEVTPEGLAAFNNENGFTEKDVRALCDVARSTKVKREVRATQANGAGSIPEEGKDREKAGEVKKIGKFGLGFKSVFAISDRPHLFSKGFAFKFEASDPTGLGFVLPHWLEPPEAHFYLPASVLASANWVSSGANLSGLFPGSPRRVALPGSCVSPGLARFPATKIPTAKNGVAPQRREVGCSSVGSRSLRDEAGTRVTSSFFQVAPSAGPAVGSSSPSAASGAPLASSASSASATWRTVVWLPLKASLLSGVGAECWRAPQEGLAARLAALCPEELLFLRQLTRVSSCLRLSRPPVFSVVEKRVVALNPEGDRAGDCGAGCAEAEAGGAWRRLSFSGARQGKSYTVQRVRLASRHAALREEEASAAEPPAAEDDRDNPRGSGASRHPNGETRKEEDWILVRCEFSVLVPAQREEEDARPALSGGDREAEEMERRRTEIVVALPLLSSGHAAAPVYGLETRPSFDLVPDPEAPSSASPASSSSRLSGISSALLPAVPESRPVFCYLPIRSFGLPFVLHAPFELTASRESLVVSSFFNLQLRAALPETFLAALHFCKRSDLFPLQTSFLRFLPFFAAKDNDFFAPAAREILRLLRQEPCVMVIDPAARLFSSTSLSSSSLSASRLQKRQVAETGSGGASDTAEAGTSRPRSESRPLPFIWAAPTIALLPSASLPANRATRARSWPHHAASEVAGFAAHHGLGRAAKAGGLSESSLLADRASGGEPASSKARAVEGQGGDRDGAQPAAAPPRGRSEVETGGEPEKEEAGDSGDCATASDDLQARLVSPALLKQHLNLFYVHPTMLQETGEEALRRLGVRAFSLWDAVEFLRSAVACHTPTARGRGGSTSAKAESPCVARGDRENASAGSTDCASRVAAIGRAGEGRAEARTSAGAEQDWGEADEVLSAPWVGLFLCFLDELVEKGDYTRDEIHFAFEALKTIPFLPTSSGLRVAAGIRSESGRRGRAGEGRAATHEEGENEKRPYRTGGAASGDAFLPLYVLVGDNGVREQEETLFSHSGLSPRAAFHELSPFGSPEGEGGFKPPGAEAETETAVACSHSSSPSAACEGDKRQTAREEERRRALLRGTKHEPEETQGAQRESGDNSREEAHMRHRTRRAVEHLVRILSPEVFQAFRASGRENDGGREHADGFPKEKEDERALQRIRALRSLSRLGVQEAGAFQLISSRVIPLLSDPAAAEHLADSTLVSLLAFLALHLDDLRVVLRSAGQRQRPRSGERKSEREVAREQWRDRGRWARPRRGPASESPGNEAPSTLDRRQRRDAQRAAPSTDEELDEAGKEIWKSFQVLTAAGERVALGDWRLRLPVSLRARPLEGTGEREVASGEPEGLFSGKRKKGELRSLLEVPQPVELSSRYFDYAPVETWAAFFSFLGLTNFLPVQKVVYELAWQSARPPLGASGNLSDTDKGRKQHGEALDSRAGRGKEADCLLSLRLLQIEDQVFAASDYTCAIAVGGVASTSSFASLSASAASAGAVSDASSEKLRDEKTRESRTAEAALGVATLPLNILQLLVASRTPAEWQSLVAHQAACKQSSVNVEAAPGTAKNRCGHEVPRDLSTGQGDERESPGMADRSERAAAYPAWDETCEASEHAGEDPPEGVSLLVEDFISLDFELLSNSLVLPRMSQNASLPVSPSSASAGSFLPASGGCASRSSPERGTEPERDPRDRTEADDERRRALLLSDILCHSWETRIQPFLAAACRDTPTTRTHVTSRGPSPFSLWSSSSSSSAFPSAFLLQLRTRRWLPACEVTTAAAAEELEKTRGAALTVCRAAEGRRSLDGCMHARGDDTPRLDPGERLPEVTVVMDVEGDAMSQSDSSLDSSSSADEDETLGPREGPLHGLARGRKRRRGSGRSPQRQQSALSVDLERAPQGLCPSAWKRQCLCPSGDAAACATRAPADSASPPRGKRRRSGPRQSRRSRVSPSPVSSLSHLSSSEEVDNEWREQRKRKRSANGSRRTGRTSGNEREERQATGDELLRWTYSGLAAPASLHAPSDRVFAVYGHLVRFLDPQCSQLWSGVCANGEEAEQKRDGADRPRTAGREQWEAEDDGRKREKGRGIEPAENRELSEQDRVHPHSLLSFQGRSHSSQLAGSSSCSSSSLFASCLGLDPRTCFSPSSSDPLSLLGVGTRPTVVGALALFHDLGVCLSCPGTAKETRVGSAGDSGTRAALSSLLVSSFCTGRGIPGSQAAGDIAEVLTGRSDAFPVWRGSAVRLKDRGETERKEERECNDKARRSRVSVCDFSLPPLPSLALWHVRGLQCVASLPCLEDGKGLSCFSSVVPSHSPLSLSRSSSPSGLSPRSPASTALPRPSVFSSPSSPSVAFSGRDTGRSVAFTPHSQRVSELCAPCAALLDGVARLLLFLAEAAGRETELGVCAVPPLQMLEGSCPEPRLLAGAAWSSSSTSETLSDGPGDDAAPPALWRLLRSCFQRDRDGKSFLLLPVPSALVSSTRGTELDQTTAPHATLATCMRGASQSPVSSSSSLASASPSSPVSGGACGESAAGCLRWLGVGEVYWSAPPGVSELFAAEGESEDAVRSIRRLLVDIAEMRPNPSLPDCFDALLKLTTSEDEAQRRDVPRVEGHIHGRRRRGGRKREAGAPRKSELAAETRLVNLAREDLGNGEAPPRSLTSASGLSFASSPVSNPSPSSAWLPQGPRSVLSEESRTTQAVLLLLFFACELLEQERRSDVVSALSARTKSLATSLLAADARGRLLHPHLNARGERGWATRHRNKSGLDQGRIFSDGESEEEKQERDEHISGRQGSPVEATRSGQDCKERAGSAAEARVGVAEEARRRREEETDATMRRLRALFWELPIIPTCVPASRPARACAETGVSAPFPAKQTSEETQGPSCQNGGGDGDSPAHRDGWFNEEDIPKHEEESRQTRLEEGRIIWVPPRDGLSLVAYERDAEIWTAFASLFTVSASSPSPCASSDSSACGWDGDESSKKANETHPRPSPDLLRSRLTWLPESILTLDQVVEREELKKVAHILSPSPWAASSASAVPGVSSVPSPSVRDVEAYLRAEARLGVLRLQRSLSRLFPDAIALASGQTPNSMSHPPAGAWPPSAGFSWRLTREKPLPFRSLWVAFLREAFAARFFHTECVRQVSASLPFLPGITSFSSFCGELNSSSARASAPSPGSRGSARRGPSGRTSASLPAPGSAVGAGYSSSRLLSLSPSRSFSPPLPLEALELFLAPSLKRLLCCALLPFVRRYLFVRLPHLYRFLVAEPDSSLHAGSVVKGAEMPAERSETQGEANTTDGACGRPRIFVRLRQLKLYATGDLGLRLLHRATGVASPVQRQDAFLLGFRGSAEDEVEDGAREKDRGAGRETEDDRLSLEDEELSACPRQEDAPSSLPLLLAIAEADHFRWFTQPAAPDCPPFQLRFVPLPPEVFREFSRVFSLRGEPLEALATFLHLCYTVQLQCLLVKQLEGQSPERSKRASRSPGSSAENRSLQASLADEICRFLTAQGLPSLSDFRSTSVSLASRKSDEAASKSADGLRDVPGAGSSAGDTAIDYTLFYRLHGEDKDGDEGGAVPRSMDPARLATTDGGRESLLWADEWIREALREDDRQEYDAWRKLGEGVASDEEKEREGVEGDGDGKLCDEKLKTKQNSRSGEARNEDGEEGERHQEEDADGSVSDEAQRPDTERMRGPETAVRNAGEEHGGESLMDEFFVSDLDRQTVPHIFGGLLTFGKEGMETESTDPRLRAKEGSEQDSEVRRRERDGELGGVVEGESAAGELGRDPKDTGKTFNSLQRDHEGEERESERRENAVRVRETLRLGAFTAEDLELPPGFEDVAPRRQLPTSEGVSSAKTDRTGRRGEGIVFSFLSLQFKDEIQEGRCRILWVNEDEESGTPYDILVTKYGQVGSSALPESIYIEVKATSSQSKSFFEVSHKEWQFAQQHGDHFHIYRVLDAEGEQPRILRIVNPYRQWRENRIGICIAL
ncbi:hypothetical protein NCLIV_044430 [Neospora caninum Liverpool]|uniref:SWIM-type domain-containing protein n=1 Tax=Neospora caninum (strain Liverpool) TaxID=572307 RepID=F0VB05_NEOCL|nr:hypothetical protein NCLIV_044430 [Neospora caninum Liverpool]CBZ51381.1 hypothetical protein NCLIV_044430 [Neospora caninum Liverpool]|eukprot:XP_003881414.1 hypothetical protein NCLIV_044430 [Neospora caninum Liverpool]